MVLVLCAILFLFVVTFASWKPKAETPHFRVRLGSSIDCAQADCDDDERISTRENVPHRRLHVARDSNSRGVHQRRRKEIVQAAGDESIAIDMCVNNY